MGKTLSPALLAVLLAVLFLAGCTVTKPVSIGCCVPSADKTVCASLKDSSPETTFVSGGPCNVTDNVCNVTVNITSGTVTKNDITYTVPICSNDTTSCMSSTCTAEVCGSLHYNPTPVASYADSVKFKDEATATGSVPEATGLEKGRPVGLYGMTCNMVHTGDLLNNYLKNSKGSFINTFRFGVGGSFDEFERYRWLFPYGDAFCNVNPLPGGKERYMNYMLSPSDFNKKMSGSYTDPASWLNSEGFCPTTVTSPFLAPTYSGGSLPNYKQRLVQDTIRYSTSSTATFSHGELDSKFYMNFLSLIYADEITSGTQTASGQPIPAPFECQSGLDCASGYCNFQTYNRMVCKNTVLNKWVRCGCDSASRKCLSETVSLDYVDDNQPKDSIGLNKHLDAYLNDGTTFYKIQKMNPMISVWAANPKCPSGIEYYWYPPSAWCGSSETPYEIFPDGTISCAAIPVYQVSCDANGANCKFKTCDANGANCAYTVPLSCTYTAPSTLACQIDNTSYSETSCTKSGTSVSCPAIGGASTTCTLQNTPATCPAPTLNACTYNYDKTISCTASGQSYQKTDCSRTGNSLACDITNCTLQSNPVACTSPTLPTCNYDYANTLSCTTGAGQSYQKTDCTLSGTSSLACDITSCTLQNTPAGCTKPGSTLTSCSYNNAANTITCLNGSTTYQKSDCTRSGKLLSCDAGTASCTLPNAPASCTNAALTCNYDNNKTISCTYGGSTYQKTDCTRTGNSLSCDSGKVTCTVPNAPASCTNKPLTACTYNNAATLNCTYDTNQNYQKTDCTIAGNALACDSGRTACTISPMPASCSNAGFETTESLVNCGYNNSQQKLACTRRAVKTYNDCDKNSTAVGCGKSVSVQSLGTYGLDRNTFPTDIVFFGEVKSGKIGYAPLTENQFKQTDFAKNCNLKSGTDYDVIAAATNPSNDNVRSTGDHFIPPDPIPIKSTGYRKTADAHCHWYGDDWESAIYTPKYILIKGTGDCELDTASYTPKTKAFGWCEPCSYSTLAEQSVTAGSNYKYTMRDIYTGFSTTTHKTSANPCAGDVCSTADDPFNSNKNYPGYAFNATNDSLYLQEEQSKLLKESVMPIIDLSASANWAGSPTAHLALSNTVIARGPTMLIVANVSQSTTVSSLGNRTNASRSACPTCIVGFRLDGGAALSLNASNRTINDLAALKHINTTGSKVINASDFIALQFYPNEYTKEHPASCTASDRNEQVLEALENESRAILANYHKPSLVTDFVLVPDSCWTKTASQSFFSFLFVKQKSLVNAGLIGLVFSNTSKLVSGSSNSDLFCALEKGSNRIMAAEPVTVYSKVYTQPDATCTACADLDVNRGMCNRTCLNGIECTLDTAAADAIRTQLGIPAVSSGGPPDSNLPVKCPDQVVPTPCPLCSQSTEKLSCSFFRADGSSDTAQYDIKDLTILEADIISSIPSPHACCLEDAGGNFTFMKQTSSGSATAPIMFPADGNPLDDCGIADVSKLGQATCSIEVPLKTHKVECTMIQ